jgi:mRNA-degrading endonuclease RelE of RelBE toxin-antitoxin system
MYQIEWTRRAFKQLNKIDIQFQKKIVIQVSELENWPDCRKDIAIKNSDSYRLRVGDCFVVSLLAMT